MNIKTLSLILVSLVYFDVSAAEQVTVYRWIDKDNVVHFSQHQPAHDDYIEISMANNKKSASLDDKDQSSGPALPLENTMVKTDLDNDEANNLNNDKCDSARENINTLQNFEKIQFKDEKGNLKVLSALDKKQQLAMNTKQAEVYCTD